MEGLTVRRRLTAILFPERCACCDEVISPGDGICKACEEKTPRVGEPICPYCGAEKEWCHCKKRKRHYKRVVAPFYYDGVAEDGILRMKKTGDVLAAAYFAAEIAEKVRQYYDEVTFDGVVYVPSDAKSQRERGFNPGRLVAAAVAKELALPLWDALVKLFDTPPQKSLPADKRSGNVLGAFDVVENCPVAGKTFLLVDDILTTGSTADECAKMLKIWEAEEVYVAVGMLSRSKEKEDKAVASEVEM